VEEKIRIYRSEAYYIPIRQASETMISIVEERFTHRIYIEKSCEKCPYAEDRHSENCDSCESFRGVTATGGIVAKNNGARFLKIPRGGRGFLLGLLKNLGLSDKVEFIDKRPTNSPLSKPIKFLGELRAHQVEPVDVFTGKSAINGVLKGSPRMGKQYAQRL
jgi:hypothetical protein